MTDMTKQTDGQTNRVHCIMQPSRRRTTYNRYHCSRSRPVGLYVNPSNGDQEIWSLLDPLSVVCCRLQTLVEARSHGQPTTTGRDTRWEAGLLASVDRATERLQMLATSTASTAAVRDTSDISSSFTVSLHYCVEE